MEQITSSNPFLDQVVLCLVAQSKLLRSKTSQLVGWLLCTQIEQTKAAKVRQKGARKDGPERLLQLSLTRNRNARQPGPSWLDPTTGRASSESIPVTPAGTEAKHPPTMAAIPVGYTPTPFGQNPYRTTRSSTMANCSRQHPAWPRSGEQRPQCA